VSRSSETHPLSRTETLGALVPKPADYLIVAGLGTACFDAARLTEDGQNLFAVDGVMGAAVPVGLGLALARPDQRVLVLTGDGEILMNLGALATAATQAPPNLSVLCIDNGQWALTGAQHTHTSFSTDLTAVAAACGFPSTAVVRDDDDIAHGLHVLQDNTQLTFVTLEIGHDEPNPYPFVRDGVACRIRFRTYIKEL
jgi:thiamine pyrophosphate-dependent acetolactate synthase large subunit-like protein